MSTITGVKGLKLLYPGESIGKRDASMRATKCFMHKKDFSAGILPNSIISLTERSVKSSMSLSS
jgi:hypothetical protein